MINIIEPTLATDAGHCSSFINSLVQVSTEAVQFRIWANRKATINFGVPHIELCKYFYRRLRRFQSYFLYRKLLNSDQKIFISTAGRTDLMILNLAAQGQIPSNKVYLYFHWFNPNAGKLRSLQKLAIQQPHIEILGPTPSVVAVFKEAGFKNVRIVPYPITQRSDNQTNRTAEFKYLLYAGAARQDKGFRYLVDFIEYVFNSGSAIPVVIQTSAEHLDKCDADTRADIERLRKIPYLYLTILTEPLEASAYQNLFSGAIAIQLYNKNDFTDRISGVTLDAFSAGCPVATTSGTWIARMVERFGAGVLVEKVTPEYVLNAVTIMINNYSEFNEHAINAGQILQQENSASKLYSVLTE